MALTRDLNSDKIAIGTPFQKAMLALSVLTLLALIAFHLATSPKTVTIDSKHWECIDTEPYGIEARCTNLKMKKFSLRTE